MQRPFSVINLLALLAVLAIGSAAARGQSVGAALYNFDQEVRNYNLITLSTTATTSFSAYGDTQAGLAVRGNLSLSGGAIAEQSGNFGLDGDPTLYVGGVLTLNGGTQLDSGYASLSSANTAYTWNAANHDLISTTNSSNDLNVSNAGQTTDPVGSSAPAHWNWSTVQSSLISDSTALASAATNGTISVDAGQNLVFKPDTTPALYSTVVFTLDAHLLIGNTYNGANFSNISIGVPDDVNYVVNVINAGGTTLFSGPNFNSGSNDTNLLWNIEGSGTVALGGGQFYGSVLAPSATITNNGNTTINGQVAANAFTDTNTELHYLGFTAVAVVIPEPVTFALWGVGLCALAICARRRLLS